MIPFIKLVQFFGAFVCVLKLPHVLILLHVDLTALALAACPRRGWREKRPDTSDEPEGCPDAGVGSAELTPRF